MKEFIDTIERFWCETMHERVMWPIHGQYRCSTCLREYPAPFDSHAQAQRHAEPSFADIRVTASLRQW